MIESIAKAMWQDESLRAAGRPRFIDWSEEAHDVKEKWRRLARVALRATIEQMQRDAAPI